jgi:hypothetical protein
VKAMHPSRFVILNGIEIVHMISKGQMKHTSKIKPSAAGQFYSLVTYAILIISPLYDSTALSRQNRRNRHITGTSCVSFTFSLTCR